MEHEESSESLPGQLSAESEAQSTSESGKLSLPPIQSAAPKSNAEFANEKDEATSFSQENKFDDPKSEDLANDVDEDLKTFSDEDDEGQGELEDFYTLLIEHWEDIDVEGTDYVSVEQLRDILDALLSDEVIDHYQPEDLEMLAADMDADGSGYIPKLEFLDVMFRRQFGYAVKIHDSTPTGHQFVRLGDAPLDFSEKELEEAFKVFSLNENEFGANNIRAVMMAVAEMEVSAFDAKKMIEAAVTTPDKQSITFDEFKKMIQWTPADEER